MEICHAHNLNDDPTEVKRFGITVSMRPDDSFSRLLGTNWEMVHWFSTETERDRALEDMTGEHIYSRRGDRPTLRFGRIERP